MSETINSFDVQKMILELEETCCYCQVKNKPFLKSKAGDLVLCKYCATYLLDKGIKNVNYFGGQNKLPVQAEKPFCAFHAGISVTWLMDLFGTYQEPYCCKICLEKASNLEEG